MEIYLDNAATTRPLPAVLRAVADCAERCYGNSASWHRIGVEAARVVERARSVTAEAAGCAPDELVFTSGGTEANNLALKGAARASGRRKGRVVISAVEHPSVSAAARSLAEQGWRVAVVGVDGEGFVDPARVARALNSETVLVSVMHANHEIGTMQPIAEIGRLCRKRGILFHSDACQSFTKHPLDLGRLPADLVSLNAHKIHGPKGVGALFVRRGVRLRPLLDGGGQEGGLRSGTVNAPGVAGFAAAVSGAEAGAPARMRRLQERLWTGLSRAIPGLRLNGPNRRRLCNNVHVTLPRSAAKPVLRRLSAAGIFASAGSACAAAKGDPSPVLAAIGLSPRQAERSLRLSLSRWTTRAEVDAAVRAIVRADACDG